MLSAIASESASFAPIDMFASFVMASRTAGALATTPKFRDYSGDATWA